MTFAFPLAFLGLLSLPVVAALHLMRARSRQHPVSSLSLWSFLDPQVRGARARRLPLTWLLLLDLLIAALLTLAMANPQVQVTRSELEIQHTLLLLDTSASMAATDEPGSRLDAARAQITALLSSSTDNRIFTLIAFSTAAEVLGDTRLDEDTQGISERMDGLKPAGESTGFPAALALALSAVDREIPADMHVFTDAAFPDPQLHDEAPPITWHLVGGSKNNQAVLTLSHLRLSPQKIQVFARFANFDSRPVERRVVLYSDGRPVGSSQLSFEPGSTIALSWDLTGSPGSITVVLEGRDDYPIDDTASQGLQTGSGLSVLLVAENPGSMGQALAALPDVDLQVATPQEYLPGSAYDLVVFSAYLPERWPEGHVLVTDPPQDSSLLGRAALEPIRTPPFPRPDPLMVDVDFSGLRWENTWRVQEMPPALVALAADSQVLAARARLNDTQLVLLLPEVTRPSGRPAPFARHPAFPIIVANAAGLARDAGFPEQIALGDRLSLPDLLQASRITVQPPQGPPIQVDPLRSIHGPAILTTGLHRLVYSDAQGNSRGFQFGVNAGNLHESDIAPARFSIPDDNTGTEGVAAGTPASLAAWILGLVGVLLLLQAWIAWK